MAYAFTDWEGTCLVHHGIKGQKWGVRRFQNPDGTLTEAGKKRYQKEFYKQLKKDSKYASFKNVRNNETIQKRSGELKELTKKVDALFEKANDLENRQHHQEVNDGKTISDQERRKLSDLYKEAHAADDELHRHASSIADDLLGQYGKKKLNLGKIRNQSSADIVRRLLTSAAAENVYQEERQKEAFDSFKKGMSSKDPSKWVRDNLTNGNLDKALSYIDKKASKTIDEWWKKKTTGAWRSEQTLESFDAEAMRYAKKAAREMGIPANKETLYFLLNWFFNGDD